MVPSYKCRVHDRVKCEQEGKRFLLCRYCGDVGQLVEARGKRGRFTQIIAIEVAFAMTSCSEMRLRSQLPGLLTEMPVPRAAMDDGADE